MKSDRKMAIVIEHDNVISSFDPEAGTGKRADARARARRLVANIARWSGGALAKVAGVGANDRPRPSLQVERGGRDAKARRAEKAEVQKLRRQGDLEKRQ
jgi:hypothetical protein